MNSLRAPSFQKLLAISFCNSVTTWLCLIAIAIILTLGFSGKTFAANKISQSAVSTTTVPGHWIPVATVNSGDSIVFGGNHTINVANNININVIDTAANPVVGKLNISGSYSLNIGSISSSGGGGDVDVVLTSPGSLTLTSTGMTGGGGIAVNDYSKFRSYDFNNFNTFLTLNNSMTLPTNFLSTGGVAGRMAINGGTVTFNGSFSNNAATRINEVNIANATAIFNMGLNANTGGLNIQDGTLLAPYATITLNNAPLVVSGTSTIGSDITINALQLRFNNAIATVGANTTLNLGSFSPTGNNSNVTFNNTFSGAPWANISNTNGNNFSFGAGSNFAFSSLQITGTSANNTFTWTGSDATSSALNLTYLNSTNNNIVTLPSNKRFTTTSVGFSSAAENNQVIFGANSILESVSLSFSGTGLNNQVKFGNNNTITYTASSLTLASTYGNKITFGNDNTFSIIDLILAGITGANLGFGSNDVINADYLFLTGNNNFTFPSDAIMKPNTIFLTGNNNAMVFNNKFNNTGTTAMNITSSSGNNITFNAAAADAVRLTSLIISGNSANNTVSVASGSAVPDPLAMTFSGTSANNSVTLPAGKTYSSATPTFSSTGANNQLTFGAGSTINSLSWSFGSTGLNNQIIFGDNCAITYIATPLTLASAYGNKITFGNNDSFTIGTLNLAGITNANLSVGNNSVINTTNLNLTGNNDFTFPSNAVMKPATIAVTGSNNAMVFNNKFNNTGTTAMNITSSSGNNITFNAAAADAVRLTSLIISGNSASNTVSVASGSAVPDPLTMTFSGTSANNSVTLPAGKTYSSATPTFSSTGAENKLTFGAGSIINSLSWSFSSTGLDNQIIFSDNCTINSAGALAIPNTHGNKIIIGNNNTLTIGTLNLAGITNANLSLGNNSVINTTNLNLTGNNNFTFPSNAALKPSNIALTGINNAMVFNNKFDNTGTTAMTIAFSSGNDVAFNAVAGDAVRLTSLIISGNSATNNVSVASSGAVPAPITMTFLDSSNNNSIILPPGRAYSSATLTFSSTGADNKLTFGAGSAINLTSLDFSGTGLNNQVTFGDNSTITGAGFIDLNSAAYGNKITFGNNNTFDIGMLRWRGVTNANFILGNGNVINSPNGISVIQNNNFTFPSDVMMSLGSIASPGNGNNTLVFNNKFDNSVTTSMLITSNNNSYTFGAAAADAINMRSIIISDTAANNTISIANSSPGANQLFMTFSADSTNNSVTFPPGRTYSSVNVTFMQRTANNRLTFGAGSTLNAALLIFTSTKLNNHVTFGDNCTFTGAGTININSAYGNKVTLGNNNTFTIGTLNLTGIMSANLGLGSNDVINTTNLNLMGNNNFTFPSDATIKSSNIAITGGNNTLVFNNKFDNTGTTALSIVSNNGNNITFGAAAADSVSITPLTISGTSTNNVISIANSNSDPFTVFDMFFFHSSSNNSVTLPAGQTYDSTNLSFSSTGANNQVTFGANSTINSASLRFMGTGLNNQVTFGDNSTIVAGTLTLVNTYGNKVTLGNNNTLTIGTLNLTGITSANLGLSSNDVINMTNLNLTGNNNFTFPSDATMKPSNIAITGGNNTLAFNNKFDNTDTTAMTIASNNGNNVTFGATPATDAVRLTSLAISGNSANNTVLVTSSRLGLDPLTMIFSGSSSDNTVTLPPDSEITLATITFSDACENNQLIFGDNSTINSAILDFSSTGIGNKIIFGNNNKIFAASLNVTPESSVSMVFGANNIITTTDLNFVGATTNNDTAFGDDNTIITTNLNFTGAHDLTFAPNYIITAFNLNLTGSNSLAFDTNSTITTANLNLTGTNDLAFGDNNAVTVTDMKFVGINNITFGAGSTVNGSTMSLGSSADNINLTFPDTATVTVDNMGTPAEPINKVDIGTGEVGFTGTTLFADNINFSGDGKFTAQSPAVTFKSITTALSGTGSATLSNADIQGDIGTFINRLKAIEFMGVQGDKIKIACNFYADQINLGLPELILQHDLVLDGQVLSDSTTYTVGNNTVYFDNAGASKVIGTPRINFGLDNTTHGRLIVRGGSLDMDSAGMNDLTVNLSDIATTLPPVAGETYTILGAENSGQIDITDNAKVHFVIARQGPLVVWSYSNGVITRKRLPAPQVVEAIKGIIKNNGGTNTAAQNGALLSNPNNQTDAAAIFQGLNGLLITGGNPNADLNAAGTSIRGDGQNIIITGGEELLRAINALQPTIAEAADQVSEVQDQMLSAVKTRITSLNQSFSASFAQGEGNTGVAAGDDLYRHGAWTSVLYSAVDRKGSKESPGFKSKTVGIVVGADTMINDDHTIGMGISFADNKVNHRDSNTGDTSKVKSYSVLIYGLKDISDTWFAQWIGLFSRNQISNRERRFIVGGFEIAKGDFSVNAYEAQLLIGRNYSVTDKLHMTPIVGAEFIRLDNSKYKEKGTSNQNLLVIKQADHKLNAILGMSFAYNKALSQNSLILEARGNISYDVLNHPSKILIHLDGLAGDNKLANKTAGENRMFYNVGTSASLLRNRTEFSVSYDLFLAPKYVGHQGSIKARINF